MKKIFITSLITGLLIYMFFLLSNCKQSTEPGEKDETGLVVPGVGMDGVKLGDTLETVLKKLGGPSSTALADGLYRSWSAYFYDDGPHAGLEIDFIDKPDGSIGIVDLILVGSSPHSKDSYTGKTKEGIGLGSTLKEVHNVYGSPDTTLHFSDITRINDIYCFGQNHFEIAYKDSVTSGFSIGFYKPMTRDPLYNCCK